MTTQRFQAHASYLSQHRWSRSRSKKEMMIWGLLLLFSPMTVFMLFLPVIPFLYFFIRALLRFRNKNPIVSLTDMGILDQRRSYAQEIAYQDIAELYVSKANGQTQCKVVTNSGKSITFDHHIEQMDTFHHLLSEKLIEIQLPVLLETLSQGLSVAFKKLQVSQQGLTLGRKQVSWAEIDPPQITTSKVGRNRYVSLEIPAPGYKPFWASFARNSFPNLSLFFALTDVFMNVNPKIPTRHQPQTPVLQS